MFEPEKEEVAGDWRRLHNEGQTIYAPHQIIIGWSDQGWIDWCTMHMTDGNAYEVLVGKSESLGRYKSRWESDIRMVLVETDLENMD